MHVCKYILASRWETFEKSTTVGTIARVRRNYTYHTCVTLYKRSLSGRLKYIIIYIPACCTAVTLFTVFVFYSSIDSVGKCTGYIFRQTFPKGFQKVFLTDARVTRGVLLGRSDDIRTMRRTFGFHHVDECAVVFFFVKNHTRAVRDDGIIHYNNDCAYVYTYYIVRNDYRQRRVLSVGRGYCSYTH